MEMHSVISSEVLGFALDFIEYFFMYLG